MFVVTFLKHVANCRVDCVTPKPLVIKKMMWKPNEKSKVEFDLVELLSLSYRVS